MKFQFWVLENVRLPVRILQWSNLKYIKTVMDHLDDRLQAEFRNSYLGFLVDILEIQFFAQLIQALVCRGIHCDKSHELWFNVQGHLTQFELQEYAIVTRLRAGSFSKGDRYTKALEKRRLKKKYFKSLEKISCAQLEKTFVRASTPQADRYKLGLALIVEGVITAPDNNVDIDEDTLSLIDDLELFFSYPWAKVGYLLKGFRDTWACKMYDTKMKNEKDVCYIIHGFSIAMQFHEVAPASGGHDGRAVGDGHDDEFGTRAEDDETSTSNDRQTPKGNDNDGSKADESGDSNHDTSSETSAGDTEDASGRQSGALPTPMGAPSTSGL
ncbi:Hypothetical predicted protein [Olea europaea subsp. europaea]|uniref:DUF1985 domain-containing protein n=1 Tax=Olea europaea subsp. europaea TaxID=158383 RepID=A0A8S0R491_OLEEU|nr:Hypothetical predicted protein [Olea europaea subsp. europaea]